MKTKNILAFFTLCLLASIVAVPLGNEFDIKPIFPFLGIVALGVIVGTSGVLKYTLAAGVFADLTWEDGKDNMPGFTQTAYIAFRGDIETWPALNSSPTTAAEKIRLTGDFAMETDKKFWQLYATKNKISAKAEMQGEDDCKSFKNSGKLFYPGTEEECLAFAASIKNQRGVVIYIEPNGERKVFGTKLLPVYFKVSIAYGETVTGEKGMTLEWECDSNEPGYTYRGVIPITGGSVSYS